eukprot:2503561-Lingulodinium_polyedra.AAC.1
MHVSVGTKILRMTFPQLRTTARSARWRWEQMQNPAVWHSCWAEDVFGRGGSVSLARPRCKCCQASRRERCVLP